VNKNTGTVAMTPQEQALASNAQASFKDYQARWLPLQDHFASIVSDMVNPSSWQKQEAEGKGNVDVAQEFSKMDAQRSASQMASGINVGSTKFKLGVAGSASAQSQSKGMAINTGNEEINKAYLANLGAIARTGQGLATTATGGQAAGGEIASRIGISNQQEANVGRSNNAELAGFGLGAIGTYLGTPKKNPGDPAGSAPGNVGITDPSLAAG
jgi:hypothetical protein